MYHCTHFSKNYKIELSFAKISAPHETIQEGSVVHASQKMAFYTYMSIMPIISLGFVLWKENSPVSSIPIPIVLTVWQQNEFFSFEILPWFLPVGLTSIRRIFSQKKLLYAALLLAPWNTVCYVYVQNSQSVRLLKMAKADRLRKEQTQDKLFTSSCLKLNREGITNWFGVMDPYQHPSVSSVASML